MSHLILKKIGTKYQTYDKRKKKFVGPKMNDFKKAMAKKKARDEKEDKVIHREKRLGKKIKY